MKIVTIGQDTIEQNFVKQKTFISGFSRSPLT